MGSSASSVYNPPPLPILPEDQRLDAQGSNYLEWGSRMRAIFEAYGMWDVGDETPKVFGDQRRAAFAKAVLLVNMQDPSFSSRFVPGMDIFSEKRYIKLEVEQENAALLWRRLQGTSGPRDPDEQYVYGSHVTWIG